MYTVLVVVPQALPVDFLAGIKTGGEVRLILLLKDAGCLFNGSAGAQVVAIKAMQGAREFILDVGRRFPAVQFIGLAENQEERLELCNCGCCCVTSESHLPFTIPAILEKRWRFDTKVTVVG